MVAVADPCDNCDSDVWECAECLDNPSNKTVMKPALSEVEMLNQGHDKKRTHSKDFESIKMSLVDVLDRLIILSSEIQEPLPSEQLEACLQELRGIGDLLKGLPRK